MTQYAEFMEDELAPVDKNKVGRYHPGLDEIIYPFDYLRLGYLAAKVEREMNVHIYEGPVGDDYHWWIYFNDFNMWSPHDMAGRKTSA
jgi:hypothetical protein